MAKVSFLICLANFSRLIFAQSSSGPTGLTVVKSQVNPEVSISFKEANICEQPSGVKTYSGYVHLPGSVLADVGGFDINSHFVYFEARNNAATAPLALYLAGGPGESSLYAALVGESGPCYVNLDGTNVINNPWSFNNHVNMLYIDQPVQAGYSYSTLINATYNIEEYVVTPVEGLSVPTLNKTLVYGTYPDQDFSKTANTTVQAAKMLWYFAENWLSTFPGYTTHSKQISIWGNSYGGYWVPETAAQFTQNLENLPAKHPLESKNLKMDTIGITNGCVDVESSLEGYPEWAYNNTYSIRFGSEDLYDEVMNNITKSGGALDLIQDCRAAGELGDPTFSGSNATVNKICMEALEYCEAYVIASFPKLNERSPFDIALPADAACDSCLPVTQYLDTPSMQQELGVPLNFTCDSQISLTNFGEEQTVYSRPLSKSTGDPVRQNGLPRIEYLLSKDVKVAFIYGDRDYRCPWTLGEKTALATKWEHQTDFANAGYEEMQGIVTPADEGGRPALVKQYGRLSFSRVYQSGHAVSAYAPETVSRIFDRTMLGLDVVAGKKSIEGDGYHTTGPKTSWSWRETMPRVPNTCMFHGKFTKSLT